MIITKWKELAGRGLKRDLHSQDEIEQYNRLAQWTIFWFVVVETVLGYFYFAFVLKEWWTLLILVILMLPLNLAICQAWRSKHQRPYDAEIVSALKAKSKSR